MASCCDDFWTEDNINVLIEKRIARDAVFRTTNSDKIGWLQILSDLKKIGAPKSLNRVNVKRQWFKICETYKRHVDCNDRENANEVFPYYEKLDLFFKNHTSLANQKAQRNDEKKSLTNKFLFVTHYADRWPPERTDLLIDARIARNDMFLSSGRGFTSTAWQTVLSDLIKMGEPNTLTVPQVKKKWENLCTRYKVLRDRKLFDTKWPHFLKLHEFYTKIRKGKKGKKPASNKNDTTYSSSTSDLDLTNEKTEELCDEIIDENQENLNNKKSIIYADRWPSVRTKLLVERRIARNSLFDGRGLSSTGWQAILQDLKDAGAPNDLTFTQVKKKWENLCTRYKVLKDSKVNNTKWPYFKQMDNFLQKKYNSRRSRQSSESNDDIAPDTCTLVEWKTEDQLLENEKSILCRLCQQENGEHLFLEDSDLCERILECTSINMSENIELLPSKICTNCLTSINKFHEFVMHCREINKKLQTDILAVNVKMEKKDDSDKTNSDTYECTECPILFTTLESLENHLKSHKKSSQFHCELCSASFTRQSALYSHIKRHFEMSNVTVAENDLNDTNDDFFADNIGNNDDTDDETTIKQVETKEEPLPKKIYSCELCSKSFAQQNGLQNHLETHSRTIHECPRVDCNKKYLTLNSLRNHERKHLGLHSFLCVVCGKGFVTNNALKLHEKIHSDVKDHICNICSRGFSIMSNLRAHQKKHHEGHRYYCSKCPKEFLTKSSLQRHELVHTGIKEFVCDVCSSAFYTNKELLKHKRYHDGVRLFHCNQCFKTFYEKHHLTIHIRCHTGERPYACKVPGCGKSFRESQKLSRHVKMHHRIIT